MAVTERAGAPRPGVATPGMSMRGAAIESAIPGLLAFTLYALTACRTIFTGDSAELAGAAACFGVPHPPGYPLYTLLTACWTHLVPLASPAFAANLASAVHGAAAVALLFLLARRMGFSRPAAWFGAAALAVGRAFWAQSVAAEVYAFDAMLFAVAAHTAWSLGVADTRQRRVAAGFATGLWVGHRFLNVVYLPVLFLIARAGRAGAPRASRREPGHDGSALSRWPPFAWGFAASLAVFLYLPIASAFDPPIDVGDPGSLSRFLAIVRGAPYTRHLAGGTPALAAGRVADFVTAIPFESGIAVLFAVAGAWFLWRRGGARRLVAASWLLLLATNQLVCAAYNIGDIRSYHLPSLVALAMLAPAGVDAVLRAGEGGRSAPPRFAPGAWAGGALVVLAAGLGIVANYRANDLHASRAAHDEAEDLFASVASDALLLVKGDTQTHAAWYLQAIEHRAPDVLVVSLGHASGWYADALRRRHPRDPIPSFTDGVPVSGFYLKILEDVGTTRPVFFGTDPGELARATMGPWWNARTVFPRGLALEARPREPAIDLGVEVDANVAFWRDARPHLDAMAGSEDFETQMIALRYTLALQRCGEFAQYLGRTSEAADAYRAVIAAGPARWERSLVRVNESIGRTAPALDLENTARKSLRSLAADGGG